MDADLVFVAALVGMRIFLVCLVNVLLFLRLADKFPPSEGFKFSHIVLSHIDFKSTDLVFGLPSCKLLFLGVIYVYPVASGLPFSTGKLRMICSSSGSFLFSDFALSALDVFLESELINLLFKVF